MSSRTRTTQQLNLIKQLAGANVCVVGDDDQSIDRFRGAYLTNFSDFKEHLGECSEIVLDHNYRNSKSILALALQLMEHAPNRTQKSLTTTNDAGDAVTVARCQNEQAEAEFVLREVQKLIGTPLPSRTGSDGRTLTYKDIAIMSRRRNEGIKFHKILRAHGIPSEFVGSIDFFSTSVIRDMLAYLNVINNPLTAGIALNRIMKTSGITEVNVQRINAHARTRAWDDDTNASDYVYECMLDADELLTTQTVAVEELTRTLEKMHALKETTTLAELVYNVMMRYTNVYKRSLHHDDRRTMLLLNTLHEIAQQYESITKQPSVSDFLHYLDLLSGFDIDLEEREETDSVKVMTVHQSKGREFPVVFIVDAATNRFPLKYQSKPFYVPNDLSKGMKTTSYEMALTSDGCNNC